MDFAAYLKRGVASGSSRDAAVPHVVGVGGGSITYDREGRPGL